MGILYDPTDVSDTAIEVKVCSPKAFKSLLSSYGKLTDKSCHIIFYKDGMNIREVDKNENMILDTFVPRTSFGIYKIDFPSGKDTLESSINDRKKPDGIIINIDIKKLINSLSKINKNTSLLLTKKPGESNIKIQLNTSENSLSEITVQKSKPDQFDIDEDDERDPLYPDIIIESSQLINVFPSRGCDEMVMDVTPKSIVFSRTQVGSSTVSPFGTVSEESVFTFQVKLNKPLIQAFGEICKLDEHGTILAFIAKHGVKLVCRVGSMADLIVRIPNPTSSMDSLNLDD